LALLSEGVGEVGGAVSVLKGAPHPDAASLWARWTISEEGQTMNHGDLYA
jgi:ABC-type Fe3+ transport system substrate-binding protein